MALVVSKIMHRVGPAGEGGDRLAIMWGTINFDNSYPTNGEALDLSNEIVDLKAVFIENKSGYVFEYDYANKKVKAYWADYSTSTDASLIEVADTEDLSGVTGVRFLAIGY